MRVEEVLPRVGGNVEDSSPRLRRNAAAGWREEKAPGSSLRGLEAYPPAEREPASLHLEKPGSHDPSSPTRSHLTIREVGTSRDQSGSSSNYDFKRKISQENGGTYICLDQTKQK